MKLLLVSLFTAAIFSGCTQIVTAPISIAGKAVTTTLDVAGAAGGAVVNTITGGSSSKEK